MTGVLAALVGLSGGSGLTVTANNVTRAAVGFEPTETVITTQSPNTNASGGQLPYSYSWAYVSGSLNFGVLVPTEQNPTWQGDLADEDVEVAVWRVTVIDAALNTATADITVTLAYTQFA